MTSMTALRTTILTLSTAFAAAGCAPSRGPAHPDPAAQSPAPKLSVSEQLKAIPSDIKSTSSFFTENPDGSLVLARTRTALVLDIVCSDKATDIKDPLQRGDLDLYGTLQMNTHDDHRLSLRGVEPVRSIQTDGRFCAITPLKVEYETLLGQIMLHDTTVADSVAIQCNDNPVEHFRAPVVMVAGTGTAGADMLKKSFIMSAGKDGTTQVTILEPVQSCTIVSSVNGQAPKL